jgi:endo-1,4-beta-xylanase
MKSKKIPLLIILNFFSVVLMSCAQTPPQYDPTDKSWVQSADDRIDKYRKGDLNIKVVDQNGNAVSGATVNIAQKSSAFIFGSAVGARWLLKDGSDAEKYREIVKDHFNEVVFENDLKWDNWKYNPGGEHDLNQTIQALHWLKNNNIKVRGHYLAWAPIREYSFYHSCITQEQHDNPVLYKQALLNHISEVLDSTKGLIAEWDGVNHIITRSQEGQMKNPMNRKGILLDDYVGNDIYPAIFSLAHEKDPNLPLFVNEQILAAQVKQSFNDEYYDKISELKSKGVDIGGVGFMGHFTGENLPSVDYLQGVFNKFSKLGIPLKVTEFDIRFGGKNTQYEQTDAELEVQKRFTEDFLRLAFSEPAVTGVVMWGFWAGRDWYTSAALYNKDWTIKPNGQAWDDLVMHKWRTNVSGETDNKGKYDVRAFLGNYNIKVVLPNGKQTEQNITLDSREGKDVTIQL